MSIATYIAALGNSGRYTAISLRRGYGVTPQGVRVPFTPARVLRKTHNAQGRAKSILAVYPDGSHILYTWSEHSGSHYNA